MSWAVGDDITAAKLNAWSSNTDIVAVHGTNWDGTSPRSEYAGRAAPVVGGSAIFTITLPTPFTNGLLYAEITAGSNNSSLGFVVPYAPGHSLTALTGIAFTEAAVAMGSGLTIIVNYRVIGW